MVLDYLCWTTVLCQALSAARCVDERVSGRTSEDHVGCVERLGAELVTAFNLLLKPAEFSSPGICTFFFTVTCRVQPDPGALVVDRRSLQAVSA